MYADADRVVQTLLNLLGNAIKFSKPGEVVRCRTDRHGALRRVLRPDQGRGIPEDKLDSIFARFEQVDSSDAREKGGSGLGLAISRSIIEQLGGRIWAANNPTGGATFRFTLPVPADQESFEPVTTSIVEDLEPLEREGGCRRRPRRTGARDLVFSYALWRLGIPARPHPDRRTRPIKRRNRWQSHLASRNPLRRTLVGTR